MQTSKQPKRSTFILALLDLFSNFALILVWTLFLLPKGQGDTLGGDPPPEFVKDSSEKGDGTGLGAQVAKVTIDVKAGTIVVRQDGETTSLNEFIDTQGVFPDALVFQLAGVDTLGVDSLREQIESKGTRLGFKF